MESAWAARGTSILQMGARSNGGGEWKVDEWLITSSNEMIHHQREN